MRRSITARRARRFAAIATKRISRRRFLGASGAAALAGAGGPLLASRPAAADVQAPGTATPLDRFDHLVVLMFENRSFDNLLGYLYQPGQTPRGQPFNGVAGKSLSNPVPAWVGDGVRSVPVSRGSVPTDPSPDPGEEYPHVNTQLFSIVDPPSNAFATVPEMQAPYNAPPNPRQTPTMDGFVEDYIDTFRAAQGRVPTHDEYRIIMNCFGPESAPVLSALARGFGIYDAWHCAVPSNTFCNRSFFHASTSSGFVLNQPYLKWVEQNRAPTIFNRLQDAGIPWRVYFDRSQIVSLTGLIHAPALRPYWKTNFAGMDAFYADVRNGTLPAYSFIEPRMIFNHNDMHPPIASFVLDGYPIGAYSNIEAGEQLLHAVYEALRAARGPGSNAMNTMLLVTFDEHGGTYDHVASPAAVPPGNSVGTAEMGFGFDRFGLRVPAIAVSAYTQAGSIVQTPIDHAAVIQTLRTKYGLGAPLTARDAGAADLSDALNLAVPRPPSTWPVTKPLPYNVPPNDITPAIAATPLSGMQIDALGLAIAAIEGKEPNLPSSLTIGEALKILSGVGNELFGGG